MQKDVYSFLLLLLSLRIIITLTITTTKYKKATDKAFESILGK